MSSVLRFDDWQNSLGENIISLNENNLKIGKPIYGNTKSDFASFGSTSVVTLGNTTPVKIIYDRALYASTTMSWAYGSANGSIPSYNWKHSQTGYYNLTFWARTTADVWSIISVCKNNSYTNAIGTSHRTGSQSGAWGYAAELIYKVDNISDTFSLFYWGNGSAGTTGGFSGTPPSGFIASPQDGGSTPSDGYYITFNITPVSSL